MARGSVSDIVLLIVIMFMLAIGGIIGLTVLGSFNDKLAEVNGGKYNNTAELNTTIRVESAFNVMDNSFPLLFIGGNIAVLFLSFMIRSHPFFMVFTILILVVLTVLAAVFANAYYEISHNVQLTAANTEMDITDFVMQNLVQLQLVFAFIDMIVLYSFRR